MQQESLLHPLLYPLLYPSALSLCFIPLLYPSCQTNYPCRSSASAGRDIRQPAAATGCAGCSGPVAQLLDVMEAKHEAIMERDQ